MDMRLLRFRITKFRSVDDSGWIEVDDVTTLIGTNESGKTNLFLPLWKLNPAKDGDISPTADYPRKLFNQIRNLRNKPIFVETVFDVGESLAQQLSEITKIPVEAVREVNVARDFDGDYSLDFPKAAPRRVIDPVRLLDLFDVALEELEQLTPLKSEQELRANIIQAVQDGRTAVAKSSEGTQKHLAPILTSLQAVSIDHAPKTSTIAPRFERLRNDIETLLEEIAHPHPNESEAARKLVLKFLPQFVYYSNYGNLDSEIYLPHVIENLKRHDLGTKEAAKARTLRVLFRFVGLQPQEILSSGVISVTPMIPIVVLQLRRLKPLPRIRNSGVFFCNRPRPCSPIVFASGGNRGTTDFGSKQTGIIFGSGYQMTGGPRRWS